MSAADKLPVLRTVLRLLALRITAEELRRLDRRHLAFGLVATWIVGMGRYWDDPRAVGLQHLGLGSLVYVVVLAAVLWAVVLPVARERCSYARMLTFVSLTAPPAILYALPVERFLTLSDARSVNVGFLAGVAIWRVALLIYFLRRGLGLSSISTAAAGLLPLVAIVNVLVVLNLEHAVFDIMSGVRAEGTANDSAYQIVVVVAFFSFLLAPFVAIAYVVAVVASRRERRLSARGSLE